ncbi:hypothetical protein [Amycolatopsis tolypomycina]|uniref:hypothetical protein n=1 Tax=Amycolatopsis tolypomycina TaxID=208445 RepID=UPI0033B61B13
MSDDRASGEHRYPASTSDFVKLLREDGIQVEYEHEKSQWTLVEYKSFDVWVPILDLSLNVAANIPANIIATMIMNYVKKVLRRDVKNANLHVNVSIRKKNGTVAKFEASGPGPEVLEALKVFEHDARE